MNNFNEDMAQYEGDLMDLLDTILLGRVTYEIMTNYWPSHPEEPGADNMNNTPKIVFSKILAKSVGRN